MRHSIKLKFFAAFTAVALVFIALISVLNLFFYDDYYMMERRRDLRGLYQEAAADYNGTVDSIYSRLLAAEEAQGVRLTVLAANGTVLYDTTLRQFTAEINAAVPHPGFGSGGLRDALFSDLNLTARALQAADPDRLTQEGCDIVTVAAEENEYLCLVGRLGENYLISRTAIAYVETNSSFNSTFLLIAGFFSLLVCIAAAYLISRRFTTPLVQMSRAADAMAGLDFSQKVQTRGEDEVAQLGRSLNLLSEHLEHAVAELQRSNAHLSRENEEKARIDAMRREFIINVSHELKTPIALIRGYAEGLREGVAEDPEDRKYYCDTICDEAVRMNEMVLQLLSLSKLEDGHETAEYGPVELRILCAAAVDKVAPLAQERGLRITNAVPPLTIWSDADLLDRILSNYLTNAIRYTPDGGAIHLNAFETADGGAVLRVHNEGEGVAEDELD
ncbi:MAG: HAMP domain-containing protein, partial [Butyricicoccus sp.]|nr:HAMP domain-containing protein [Butyricicoccus sp.]